MYTVPSETASNVEKWIAVPNKSPVVNTLFDKRDDKEGIITRTPDSVAYKHVTRRFILQNFSVPTVGQRCANWFVLRQFRITGTGAGNILMKIYQVRSHVGMSVLEESQDVRLCEVPKSFARNWFCSSRATAPILRGTTNESPVVSPLSSQPFIKSLYQSGMLSKIDKAWLACSLDGIAIIDIADLFPRTNTVRNTYHELDSLEIKTGVSQSSLDRAIRRACGDILMRSVGDYTFQNFIRLEHVGEILHQIFSLSVSFVVYVSTSEVDII